MKIATSASRACKKLPAIVADSFSVTNQAVACDAGIPVVYGTDIPATGCINTITNTITYAFSDDPAIAGLFSFIPVILSPSKGINHLPLPLPIFKNSFLKIKDFRFCTITALTTLLIIGLNQSTYAQGWYNTGGTWNYRKAITIDFTKVPNTDQSNFPVLVSLTADAALSAHALASGNDILFTLSDGTTKIPYQRESYAGGTLTAWIQVPTLSHTANTVIYMYYGNSVAGDQQQAAGVWDATYAAVYHLSEPGAGTAGEYKESKAGTINGTVTDQVIKAVYNMTGTGNLYLYQELTNPSNYTIAANDTLMYDVYWTSLTDDIAFDFTSSDGSINLRDNGATDQNGLGAHPASDLSAFALNKWYHRVIPIPAVLNAKTIGFYDVVCESDVTGSKTGYITNIYIQNGGIIKKVIYTSGGSTTNSNHLVNGATLTSFGNVVDPTVRSVGGQMGNAVNTDAARYLNMSARATNVTSGFTLEAWVKPNVLSQHGYFLFNGNQAAGYGFGMGDGTGKLGSKLIGLYGVSFIPSTFIFTGIGTWNHVVMERSAGGTTSFYVNGVAYAASSGGSSAPIAPNNVFTIGNALDASSNANRYFNGPIDEVRISTTARSSDWIATEYNNQSSPSTFYSLGTETLLGPAITGFIPASGCANTTPVVITGTNFTGATAVKFGGTDAFSFTVNSATQITATPAAGTTGTISVNAPIGPTGTGTSASTFTVNSLPAASATKTDISCFNANNGTITVSGNGGSNTYAGFSITNGLPLPVPNGYQAGATFNGLVPGQYKIRVIDSNGCESKQVQ